MNGAPDIEGPVGEDSVLTELLAQRNRIFGRKNRIDRNRAAHSGYNKEDHSRDS